MKRLPFIALAICACLSACSSTSDDAKTCSNHRDCDTGDICQNGFCIPEPECWAAKPCVDDNKRCDNGKCVDKPAPTPKKANGESCSAHDECVSSYCGFDRTCANAPACSDSMPCSNGDQYCDNGVCIDRIANGKPCNSSIVCKSGFCNAQKTCETKPECDDANPCADKTKICKNEKCVDKPECDDANPCADKTKICKNEKCVDKPECDDANPCADETKVCQNGKCIDKDKVEECVSDSECGNGKMCDNKQCVDADSCSITRTCKDKKVCQNGKCIDKPHTTCDSKTPCTATGETCVAGKCVACQCGNGEICTADGTCIDKNTSKLKNIKVGDVCEWSPDFKFCDNNRLFTCSKAQGEADYTVGVRNCGAGICANSPTEDWNCFEPCPNEGDVYGECWDDYNSAEQTSRALAFKTKCTMSEQGLIWTFTPGYETCRSKCVDGSCVNVPNVYGTACYEATFTNACQGDWNLFCVADKNKAGIVSGEDCIYGYANDSQKFYCAYNDEKEPECVTACTEDGKKQSFCHDNGYGTVMSDTRVCRKGADGKLAFFLDSYTVCAKGCDSATGLCR